MWKANGNNTTPLFFLDSLFPKIRGDRSDRKTRKKT
jgi:hypothetical protein